MNDKLAYTVFKTKMGWIVILGSKDGLRAITLPQTTREQALDAVGERVKQAELSTESFSGLEQKLKGYYAGTKTAFIEKLDFSNATPFQRQVWEAAKLIPCGETRSYGWIAQQIGKPKAARAVGSALGKNPFLVIVPCHRVIAGDGTLGGFGGGLPMKQKLLKLEKEGLSF